MTRFVHELSGFCFLMSIQLYGSWYQDTSQPIPNHLFLERKDPQQLMWGQQYILEPNGTFADIYAVRCGNDPQYHHWQGTWTFDCATQLLLWQCPSDQSPRVSRAVLSPQSPPTVTRFQIEDLSPSTVMLRRCP